MKKLLQIVAGILRFFNNPIYRFWFQHSQSHVSFTGQRCSPLLRALGRRYFVASTEEYAKRNYASNVSEYTTVVSSLTAQRRSFANLIVLWRNLMGFVSFFSLSILKGFIGFCCCGGNRHFLLRDAYDDMMLDGVQPSRDIFHSLIVGTMKGARLQDAFFFIDQMKTMGLVPDVCRWWVYYPRSVKTNLVLSRPLFGGQENEGKEKETTNFLFFFFLSFPFFFSFGQWKLWLDHSRWAY